MCTKMLSSFKILLLLASIFAVSTKANVYDGFKVFDVVPETIAQVEVLSKLAKQEQFYDFFTLRKQPGVPARVMVNPNEEENFLQLLSEHQMSAVTITENVGKVLDAQFAEDLLSRTLKRSADKGRLSTEQYYSHAEINNYIADLARRYPTRAYVRRVGTSYEGRIINTITITNGDGRANKQVIFVDGAFHAREWISPAAVLYIIEQLVENFAENAELLRNFDWIILPVVNPDGYEHTRVSSSTRLWRKTRQPLLHNGQICYGTDPNRNFDFHWNEEGASSNPCADTFAGPTPFSEPETIVVRDLLHSLNGRGVMYLTLHSYGNYLLYPWGWTSDLPDTVDDLDEVARAGGDAIREATGTVYTVGSSTNVLYIAAGASDDYAFYAGFPISITMELPAGGLFGFNPPATSIDKLVKETWIGIRAMGLKTIEKYGP